MVIKNAKRVTVKEKKTTEKKGSTQEHQNLLKKVLLTLSSNGVFAYSNNTGAMKVGKRYQRFGYPGSPDILGILPDGRYLGIEIKTGNAVQNKNQKKFERKIKDNNGEYWVIRSIEELDGKLTVLGLRNKRT